MSIKYMALEDQLIALLQAIEAEPDTVQRLKNVKELEAKAIRWFRELKYKSAYSARLSMRAVDIADAIGSDRKDIDYWVRCHYESKGLERPPYRKQHDLSAAKKVGEG